MSGRRWPAPYSMFMLALVGLVAVLAPFGHGVLMRAVGPAFAGRGDLGRFYDSVDYTPASIKIVAIIDRAETLCGGFWCLPSTRKETEKRFAYPLRRELNLNVPPALVNRLSALDYGIATVFIIIWASDGMPLKERPEGLPPDADRATILDAINRRTKERLAAGDRIVHVDMQSTWKPTDIVALEWTSRLATARDGGACSVDSVEGLGLVRTTYHSPGAREEQPCHRRGANMRAACEDKRAKACSEYPRHAVARSFFKPAESGEVSYVVDCPGGRSLDPAAAAAARLDPMTEYWRADGPTATGQLGGPRCTLRGHWGEWRFEALVDRDQPERWGNIHAHVLKLYARLTR